MPAAVTNIHRYRLMSSAVNGGCKDFQLIYAQFLQNQVNDNTYHKPDRNSQAEKPLCLLLHKFSIPNIHIKRHEHEHFDQVRNSVVLD